MPKKTEFAIRIFYTDGKEEVFRGFSHHEFYKETVRLRRHHGAGQDVFIPLKNVRSLVYAATS